MSETWRRAHRALLSAASVTFIGYSIPIADGTSAGMLASALSFGSARLTVVNPRPAPVADTLLRLTNRQAERSRSVQHFVNDFVDAASRDLADRCHRHQGADPTTCIAVGWSPNRLARVVGLTTTASDVVLELRSFDSYATATVDAPGTQVTDRRPPVTLATLQKRIRPGHRLVARFDNKFTSPLVGADGFRTQSGASTWWQVLTPADRFEDTGAEMHGPLGSPPTPVSVP